MSGKKDFFIGINIPNPSVDNYRYPTTVQSKIEALTYFYIFLYEIPNPKIKSPKSLTHECYSIFTLMS